MPAHCQIGSLAAKALTTKDLGSVRARGRRTGDGDPAGRNIAHGSIFVYESGVLVYSVLVPATGDRPQPSAESLAGLLEFETLISDLSSRFINLPPAEVDREIEDALRRVCESLGVDLRSCGSGRAQSRTSSHPPRLLRPGGPAPSEPLNQEQFPWAVQQDAGRPQVLPSPRWMSCRRRPPSTGRPAAEFGIKSNLGPPALGGRRTARWRPGLNTLRKRATGRTRW